LTFMDYTMNACPPILEYVLEGNPAYTTECRLRNEAIFRMIKTNRYRHVILAAYWPNSPEAGKQLLSTVEAIISTNALVTLVINNVTIERAGSCPLRRIMYRTDDICEGVRQNPRSYFDELKARYPQVKFIDPNEVICQGRRCNPMHGDILLYRDNNHLNDIGSRLIGQVLLSKGITL